MEQATQFLPNLIVCDVTMPYLDGFGVLLEVHSNPALTHIPFIFVTARATHNDIRHGMNLGANDYIVKPFTAQTLKDKLNKIFEQLTAPA